MIILNNVTKFYKIKKKRHFVLENLSHVFKENISIGILGVNGAGKSTLLRMIGGIEVPNSGTITSTSSISWPVGLTSGFQGSLTARENIKFVCQIYGKNLPEQKRITNYVYDFAEIGKFFDMPIKTYSSGMKGRVNFGLSMAFDFDYYLVDEVTGVGDAKFKAKAKAVFDEKRKKSSIIMVSHSMKTLTENCDSGIFLEKGKFLIFDDIKDAIARYQKK